VTARYSFSAAGPTTATVVQVNVNSRKGYQFAGAGSYGGLLDGEVLSPTVEAPTGFESVFTVRHALDDPMGKTFDRRMMKGESG